MRRLRRNETEKELIRVVRCEDGNFVLDATGKKTDGAHIFVIPGIVWAKQ